MYKVCRFAELRRFLQTEVSLRILLATDCSILYKIKLSSTKKPKYYMDFVLVSTSADFNRMLCGMRSSQCVEFHFSDC